MGLRVRFPSVSQMYLMFRKGRVGSSPTSGTIKCFNMERYIKELVEIYTSNTLKSKEELESLKKLIMNAHRAGFIAGEESIVNVIDKLTK